MARLCMYKNGALVHAQKWCEKGALVDGRMARACNNGALVHTHEWRFSACVALDLWCCVRVEVYERIEVIERRWNKQYCQVRHFWRKRKLNCEQSKVGA